MGSSESKASSSSPTCHPDNFPCLHCLRSSLEHQRTHLQAAIWKKKNISFSYGTPNSFMYSCLHLIGLKLAIFLRTGHTYLQGRIRISWHIDTSNKFSVTKEQNGCWDLCQVRSFTNMFCECEIMRHLCINLICLITTPGVDWCYSVSSVQIKAHSPLCNALGKLSFPMVQQQLLGQCLDRAQD